MRARYIHFVQILRDGHWIDFESWDDLSRARRRATEFRQQGTPAQVVSAKSMKAPEANK